MGGVVAKVNHIFKKTFQQGVNAFLAQKVIETDNNLKRDEKMKKAKTRYIKNSDGSKKSILKFKDGLDDEFYEDQGTMESKRRKDVGKRLHRKKTAKDDFLDSELRTKNQR